MIKRRNIRPAEEEIGTVLPVILFSAIWYGSLGSLIFRSGFEISLLLFLIAGILLPYQAVTNIRRALFYRKQRADAIALGRAAAGRITSVTRQSVPCSSGRHGSTRYRTYYFPNVEMSDPVTGAIVTIQSQGYRLPIHRYLRSDQVKVYTDRSGWKHYLEDFQWRERRSDPDLFGPPREFEETSFGGGRIVQIIFVVILILMLLQIFR